jgi:hypothetical protein
MRLAQITDPHLPFYRQEAAGAGYAVTRNASGRGSRSAEGYLLFARTLSRVMALGVDACVITGDLLNIQWEEPGLRITRLTVLRSYREINRILDSSGIPWLALPGNHDHERFFWKVFKRSKNSLGINGYNVACFFDAEGKAHIPHRRGRELRRFKRLCADRNGPLQIHVQHYLLTDPTADNYPYSYACRAELRRRITDSGRVVLCVSGHYHKGTGLIVDSGCCYAAGPALSEKGPYFRIYDIQGTHVTCRDYRI